MTTFPTTLKFISDDTVAVFVREDVKAKERTAFYEYTVSKNNFGKVFPMSMDSVQRLIDNKLCEI